MAQCACCRPRVCERLAVAFFLAESEKIGALAYIAHVLDIIARNDDVRSTPKVANGCSCYLLSEIANALFS